MDTAAWLRISARSFWIMHFFIVISAADELSLDVSHPSTLQLVSGLPVEKTPGSKPGVLMLCERVHIHGLSRFHGLRKYAHLVKVKVKITERSPKVLTKNVEVCFHRNLSLGLGMCPQGHWERVLKGSWVRTMSPYDNRLLDIRMPGPSMDILEVSMEEEISLYRIMSLVLGIVMLTAAPALSKSIVFYYSSAMAVGIILVILIVLFQGMKLLPTGRKNSLAIFIYSSLVGLGSFLLHYLPRLLQTVLKEIGISEDMYNPLVIFLLFGIVLAGAWLGFWVVHKLVLTEDGSIDLSIATFVLWSIRTFAAIMITQSSLDPLLGAEALVSIILASSIIRGVTKLRYMRHLHRQLFKMGRGRHRRFQTQELRHRDSYNEDLCELKRQEEPKSLKRRTKWFTLASCNSPILGLSKTPPKNLSDSETYYSSFHNTPERKKFSKEEWEKLTRNSTKKALEGLVSSPDFNKWAVANAERITLTPTRNGHGTFGGRRKWFYWF